MIFNFSTSWFLVKERIVFERIKNKIKTTDRSNVSRFFDEQAGESDADGENIEDSNEDIDDDEFDEEVIHCVRLIHPHNRKRIIDGMPTDDVIDFDAPDSDTGLMEDIRTNWGPIMEADTTRLLCTVDKLPIKPSEAQIRTYCSQFYPKETESMSAGKLEKFYMQAAEAVYQK